MEKKRRSTHLIIPDAHAHPNYDNTRFTALGNYIAEVRPTHVICLGDFADMPSLSAYEKGKLSLEGARYRADIDAARDAMNRLFRPIRTNHHHIPRLILTLGNHEQRIVRAVQDNSILAGKLELDDLGYKSFGWKVCDFLHPICVDGIFYSHYFVSGIRGQSISGENPAKQMCLKLHRSAVSGHSHIFDHSERMIIGGTKIFGLHAGCFSHPDYDELWCKQSKEFWWRGVVVLKDLDGEGYYDAIEAVTMRKILREYS